MVLCPDHPEQATQSGLLQFGPVVRQDDLSPVGHHIQSRRFCGQFRQLANHAHHVTHLLATPQQTLLIRVAAGRRADDDQSLEAAAHLDGQPFGVGQMVGVFRPVQRCALCAKGFQRIRKPRFQQISLGGVYQQPASDGPLRHRR